MLDYDTGRYCAYLRKSRADLEAEARGEGETLARHQNMLLELSKRYKKPITQFYKEIVSGENISARPVMQQLLSDVEKGMWQGVYVVEVERLARGDTADQGVVERTFRLTKTQVITPTKTYIPGNEFDEEYLEFGLFMSRREYKTINRRIQRGRLESVKEGRYIFPVAPYGYVRYKIKGDKGYSLRPEPVQADIIRLIFDLYVNGKVDENGIHQEYGSTRIAKYLDSISVKPMINDKWSRATIKDILQNPIYIGKTYMGKRKEIASIECGVVKKTRPNAKDYELYKGLHEAIISEELFNKAKNIMKSRVRAPLKPNTALKNPLAGLVYCKKCGSLMTRLGENSKTKYAALKCPDNYCKNISSPLFLVEEKIIQFLGEWIKSYQIDLECGGKALEDDAALKILKTSIDTIENEIKTVQKQIDKTYELLEKEIYTTEIFMERNKTLVSRIDELSESLEVAKKSYESENKRNKAKNELIPTVVRVIEAYKKTDVPAEKNRLLKEVLESVVYDKNEKNTRGQLLNANFEIEIFPRMPK